VNSTLLWMIDRNIAPGHCGEWTEEVITSLKRPMGKNSSKKPEEVARILVNGCSQSVVAERLAREWPLLGGDIRMEFTDLANKGWRSGNVTKGLLRLDKLLGGKILRREYVEERKVLKERGGKTFVASGKEHDDLSTIKWKFVLPPPDHASWSPARKKKYQQQLARERRQY